MGSLEYSRGISNNRVILKSTIEFGYLCPFTSSHVDQLRDYPYKFSVIELSSCPCSLRRKVGEKYFFYIVNVKSINWRCILIIKAFILLTFAIHWQWYNKIEESFLERLHSLPMFRRYWIPYKNLLMSLSMLFV